ncbi:nucleolar protein 14 homolog l(3)07882 isoform X1 [Andrena cerasifolii]|uniref:nucleolar protein 14 homolog l(3)07882 isoform X1 n=1 Tax=Andrena cerasifolii TaxID=2819439 RepID=UPI0040380F72
MAKAKKKLLSELTQQKRSQQNTKRLNPFEVHINRDKQNVLGKKGKADRGLPGVSRAKAINKRKGTLLQEYKLKNKDNVFLDKRIGERNVAMSEEDKAMARFAAERIKAHRKKNIYSLNDEEVLTHRGQTLEEIEKFDDPKSDDEFSDDGNRGGKLDDQFVGDAHFGGGILSRSEAGKSRKDLIDELIAESKKRKAEKQKIREQTVDLTEKLDSEWKDLLPIVSAANKTIEVAPETKADDYDIAVRELKFEARGAPSDRLKSEEEIIKGEKERLEALEADRLARMKGFVNDPSNEIRHKSADDLDDGFALETINDDAPVDEAMVDEDKNAKAESSNEDDEISDAENNDDDDVVSNDNEEETVDNRRSEESDNVQVNGTVKEKRKAKGSAENEAEENSDAVISEAEDSDEDNLSDLKQSECSSEDDELPSKKSVTFAKNIAESVSKKPNTSGSTKGKSILKPANDAAVPQLNEEDRKQEIRDDLLKRKEIMEKARKELPYTYKAPENFEELQEWLRDHNAEYQSVIIDRIIKCNHWSLNGKNKEKLSNMFLFLLQHLNDCAVEDDIESVVKCFQIIDRLSPFLYDLAHVNPENTKTVIQEIIKEKHEEFEKNKHKYPGLDTLIFFKLVSLIFPTSDFRHPVVTPCLIFMSQILLRCRVKNKVDISKGLFICTLVLEYTVLSKRFAPSVINFLRGVIYVSTPKHLIQGIKMIPPFKAIGESSNLLVLEDDQTDLEIDPSGALMRASDLVHGESDDDFKIRALLTALNLSREFKNQLEELEAVYPIFEPILKLLKPNALDKYPPNARKHVKHLRKDLKGLRKKKLEHIVREKKKPKPLRLYEPRIERVYDFKKHKTMSKEKAEKEKLLHKYKKEMKGAVREIRRDRTFLAKLKIKQQLKSDEERKRKVKEIFGDAATQQSELKKMKRKK